MTPDKSMSGRPCILKIRSSVEGYYFYNENGCPYYHYFISNSKDLNGGHASKVEVFNKTFGMDLKYGYCIDAYLDKLIFGPSSEIVYDYEI